MEQCDKCSRFHDQRRQNQKRYLRARKGQKLGRRSYAEKGISKSVKEETDRKRNVKRSSPLNDKKTVPMNICGQTSVIKRRGRRTSSSRGDQGSFQTGNFKSASERSSRRSVQTENIGRGPQTEDIARASKQKKGAEASKRGRTNERPYSEETNGTMLAEDNSSLPCAGLQKMAPHAATGIHSLSAPLLHSSVSAVLKRGMSESAEK
jgi:hypothetical protein